MAVTDVQRAAAGRPWIACAVDKRIDAAHLSPRSLGGYSPGAVGVAGADSDGSPVAGEADWPFGSR
jgi:hypothetical protein